MTTPLPKVGDILHSVYLFIQEQRTGREEGVKTRPVMVAAAQEQRVFTLAITTKGDKPASTLPIQDQVADAARLARGTSIVIDQ